METYHPNTGVENAVVLPRMFAPAGAMWQQYAAQRRQNDLLKAQREKEELARQDALSKYNSLLFDKDLGTGTIFDPVISEAQAKGKIAMADMIRTTPGMRTGDVDVLAGKITGRIKTASDKLKAINANIKSYTEGLNKIQGVSGKDAEAMARYELLYTDDGKGGMRMRTIEEINAYDGDPMAAAMEKHADKFISREALDTPLSKLGIAHKSVAEQKDSKGVKTMDAFDATYIPALHDVSDSGEIKTKHKIANLASIVNPAAVNLVGKNTLITLKNNNIPLPKAMVNDYPDGKIPMLDAGAFDRVFGTEGGALYLQKEIKKRHPDVDPLSPYFDVVQKNVAYELVKDYADRTGIKTKDIQTRSALATKIQLGIPLYKPGKRDGGPGGGIDETLNNKPMAIIARAMSGEHPLEGARAESMMIDGKKREVFNFARGLAGNMRLPDDIFGMGQEVRTMAQHPDDPNTIIVESTDGIRKTFKGPQLMSFFKNIAKLQSPPMTPDEVKKILDFYFDKDGALSRMQQVGFDEAKTRSRVQSKAERRQLFENLQSETTTPKASKEYKEFNGRRTVDGQQIQNVMFKKGGWFSNDKYIVSFGEDDKKVFENRETFIKYLENNID
jgi:hypothetical protein